MSADVMRAKTQPVMLVVPLKLLLVRALVITSPLR
jgi:hypothetical protein